MPKCIHTAKLSSCFILCEDTFSGRVFAETAFHKDVNTSFNDDFARFDALC